GFPGVPILPAVSMFHFIYYAVPTLRHELVLIYFTPSEVLRSSATVAVFLVAATLSWRLLLFRRARRSPSSHQDFTSRSQLETIIFLGFAMGAFFYIALFMGLFGWLGSFAGLFRSVMLTPATLACFLLGVARARGSLRGRKWALAIAGLTIIVLFSLSSLFLIGAMTYCLAAVLGYSIAGKRIPVVFMVAAVASTIVLHAGKDAIREKYWLANTNFSAEISVAQVPGLL